jgi:hypothetical protein
MDLKKLVEKWAEVLSEGKEIRSDKVKKSTALMLENQHRHLTETTAMGADSLGTVAGYATSGMFHKIAVPMVRRTFPELIAHELVGVQPLTGPVGLAFALRFRAGQTSGDYKGPTQESGGGTELGYNTIEPDYSGSHVTSAGEALGSNVTGDVGLGIGTGAAIREVNATVEKAQVEAGTRKLRSRWSLEVAQDLKAMHGLDLEEEMMDILSYEITAEIDRELIAAIETTVDGEGTGYENTWTYATTAAGTGRWEAERYRELYNFMIRRANVIATNTRRGSANWVVANPTVCAVLETLADFTIAPVNSDINTSVTGVARVGSLSGRMNVYRDTFQTADQFILGYKGPSEYDTGVIYLPYIQLLASRTQFEDSFQPTMGLMSRYAIHNHLFGAREYYQLVNVVLPAQV